MSALAWEPDQPTDIFFNGLSTLISVYFILKPGSLGLSRDRLKLGVQKPTVACASRGGQQSPPGTRMYPPASSVPTMFCHFAHFSPEVTGVGMKAEIGLEER